VKITEQDVLYVAALANLELTEDEATRLVTDLNSILAYVEKLNELDTSTVEPMAQVLYEESPQEGTGESHDSNAEDERSRRNMKQVLRDDEVRPSLPRELSLSNAPESAAGQFKVPKVIER